MDVPDSVLRQLDLESATEVELSSSNRLLPRRRDRLPLRADAREVARLLRGRYRRGKYGDAADVLFVDKNRRGRRPISELTLTDRVLYRSLVDLLSQRLPESIVSRPPIEEFRLSPLEVDNVDYVSKTDVTSYYEFVDHDRLGEELEAQTGEAPAIDVLMHLLFRVMTRRVGLPQVHRSSDVLGDAYIDVARRRLVRAGHAVTTYSDDFRIATGSLAQARSALEAVAREVRSIGLALNESKTFTYGADKYRESLSQFEMAERALFEPDDDDPFFPFIFTGDYGDEEAEATPQSLGNIRLQAGVLEDDVIELEGDGEIINGPEVGQARAAERVWQRWLGQREVNESQQDAAITESLLGKALPLLGSAGQTAPLPFLSVVLRTEPALTPQVAMYLIRLGETGQEARVEIRSTLDELADSDDFSSWQELWLAEAAGTIRPVRGTLPHYGWLLARLDNPSPSLAATCAAALSRLGKADVSQLAAVLDRVGPVWRPLVLASIAAVEAGAASRYADDRVERMLVEATAGVTR